MALPETTPLVMALLLMPYLLSYGRLSMFGMLVARPPMAPIDHPSAGEVAWLTG